MTRFASASSSTRLVAAMAAVVALAAAGLAAPPAASAAAKKAAPTGKVAGIAVTACNGTRAHMFVLFTRGVACDRALANVVEASSADRACPPAWKAKRDQTVRLGRHTSPHVTLCTRGKRAFTYHLPVG